MATLQELEAQAESKYGLPEGLLTAVRSQETGNNSKYIDNPAEYHYALNSEGKRIAGHTGKVSNAFGPYGILDSTAKQPGYGVTPLADKSLGSQVDFAANYLSGRIKHAGSVEAGLAGYGEGQKYARSVLKKVGMDTSTPTPTPAVDAAPVVARNNAAVEALNKIQQQYQGVVDSANATLRSTQDAEELITTTREAADANAKRQTLDFATAVGTNPDAANAALAKLVQQSSELFEQQRKVSSHLENAADPTQIFNNPIKWLSDYLLQPYDKARQAAITTKLNSVNEQVKFLNDSTQEFRQTADAISQGQTAATAAAKGRIARAAIDLKIGENEIKALNANADNVVKTTNMQNNTLSMKLRLADQAMQEKSFEAMQSYRANALKAQQAAMADKRTAKEAEESWLATVNMGAASLNILQFGSVLELQNYVKANPAYKTVIASSYNAGFNIQNGVTPEIASTPASAIKFNALANPTYDPGRAQLVRKVNRIAGGLADNVTYKEGLKNKNTYEATLNEGVLTTVGAAHADITRNTEDNPYAAPPLETLLADQYIAKSYLGREILAPLHRAGATEVPFKRAIGLLMEAARDGKVDSEVADSELGFLATKIKSLNNDVYRYRATVGIPNMTAVNVPVEVPTETALWHSMYSKLLISPAPPGRAISAALLPTPTKTEKIDISDPVRRAALFNINRALAVKGQVTEEK